MNRSSHLNLHCQQKYLFWSAGLKQLEIIFQLFLYPNTFKKNELLLMTKLVPVNMFNARAI